jgi:hypothetical protein
MRATLAMTKRVEVDSMVLGQEIHSSLTIHTSPILSIASGLLESGTAHCNTKMNRVNS